MVYLTPERTSAEELLSKKGISEALVAGFDSILTCATFSDLIHMELSSYPHSWQLFRDKVVSAVFGLDGPAGEGAISTTRPQIQPTRALPFGTRVSTLRGESDPS